MATLQSEKQSAYQWVSKRFSPEHVVMAILAQRLSELSRESIKDIGSLISQLADPETSNPDRFEIMDTIIEIVFPEAIGNINYGKAGAIDYTPAKLQKRMDHISSTIKYIRKEKGLTQTQLAERSGLQQSHICRLENAEHSPSFKTLEKIARALEVSVGDLDPAH